MGVFSGIIAAAEGMLVNNAVEKTIELKKNKEKNKKVISLENIFNELKKKINKYEEQSKNSESIEINNSEIVKIEEEIKNLKSKIDELNSLMEGKSKIEKMKITLNVTSIESEITLKEMDLEEEKKKIKRDYEVKIESSNKDIENIKNNLITYIQNSEEDIEKNIKIENTFNKQAVIRGGIKLTSGDIKILKNIGLDNPEDLIGFNLTSYDFQRLMNNCTQELHQIQIALFKEEINKRGLILEKYELFFGVLEVLCLYDLMQKLEPLFEKNNIKLILGTDLEEVKNYYNNIMKVEFLNLENIEKEETELNKKITPIKENIYQCDLLAKESKRQGSEENFRKYSNLALDDNNKLLVFEKENEKLKIKKEAIQNKINTVNEMVNEMIKEVIKEELKKREIVIPSFVPVTKYFNVPDEVEE